MRPTLGAGNQSHCVSPITNSAVGLRPVWCGIIQCNAMEQEGLAGSMDFPVTRLSGGQQQRVAIARAFMNNQPLIAVDEPMSNLDRFAAENVLDLMQKVNRQNKAA